jgi:hypothetical protein
VFFGRRGVRDRDVIGSEDRSRHNRSEETKCVVASGQS